MDPSSSLRSRIARAFNDEELRAFCFDRFPIIYREFTTGMTQGQMIGLLLEHCVRHKAGDALLTALEQARPGLIGADRDVLLAWLDSARFEAAPTDSGSGTTPVQTITIAGDQRNVDTSGGDYAEGNIDKREGIFGGTFHGPVVGVNRGTTTINQPSTTPALHQLRAPVGDFVGRATEITQLVAALRRAAGQGTVAAISGVRGMGGIGKTELAHKVGHQLAADFPDAQIVVELRGASDPLSPIQALQSVIRAFEREARLPDDLAELQAIYRSLLSGKRVLILADDARDSAQVRPLLPPPGSALLVTSRYRFTLPGMQTIDLGMLAPPEAVTLLLTICPRIGEAAPALAKLCGYLPLALRVSASLLRENDSRDVTCYIEQLRAERLKHLSDPDNPDDSQASVEASLRLSYDALEPAAKSALCKISVFLASFRLEAVKEVVFVEEEDTDMLELLRRRSLLEWNAEKKWYSLHDLVREFAAERVGNVDVLRSRHAHYYADIAWSLVDAYQEAKDRLDRKRLISAEEGTYWTPPRLARTMREARYWAELDLIDIEAGWKWALTQASELLWKFEAFFTTFDIKHH